MHVFRSIAQLSHLQALSARSAHRLWLQELLLGGCGGCAELSCVKGTRWLCNFILLLLLLLLLENSRLLLCLCLCCPRRLPLLLLLGTYAQSLSSAGVLA
jgi:hypothetical protein